MYWKGSQMFKKSMLIVERWKLKKKISDIRSSCKKSILTFNHNVQNFECSDTFEKVDKWTFVLKTFKTIIAFCFKFLICLSKFCVKIQFVFSNYKLSSLSLCIMCVNEILRGVPSLMSSVFHFVFINISSLHLIN